MTWLKYYTPPLTIWQGRDDLPNNACFFQTIKSINLEENSLVSLTDQLAFGLIGFCCDEGIKRNFGRLGASQGPFAIREALAKLPIRRKDVICFDVGNITCSNNNLESAQQALAEAVNQLLSHHIVPLVIGGGHELAWGHYQGIVKNYPNKSLGIVNFDAHFDMRPLLSEEKGSSGTPFLQIAKSCEREHKAFNYHCIGIQESSNIQALFETAKQYNTKIILAEEIELQGLSSAEQIISDLVSVNQIIYASICLDVFGSSYAPGVSAPQSLGLSPWQVIPLIRKLAASGKVISYDIAEMSPLFDIDKRTASLAAHILYQIIHCHLLSTLPRKF